MTPARMTTVMGLPRACMEMNTTSPTVMSENTNAHIEIWIEDRPMRMAIAAPRAAPCEAPSRSGETRGFWNVPWNAAPALARQQPIKRASTMRGKRTLKKMEAC